MTAKVLPIDRDIYRYKMKDLCQASGLDRQAIHFYIQQGLLPPGRKTGRNMAWYTEKHLDRLRLIKQLQHERFLPLKAIKALLDGREEVFEPEQQAFLQRVRTRLDLREDRSEAPGTDGDAELISLQFVQQKYGVDDDDVARAAELGFISFVDRDGERFIPGQDAWLFEALSEVRAIGFTRERRFEVDDIGFYHEVVSDMLRKEVALLSSRVSTLPEDEAARMIEQAVPLVNRMLTRLHTQLIREFFSSLPNAPVATDDIVDSKHSKDPS